MLKESERSLPNQAIEDLSDHSTTMQQLVSQFDWAATPLGPMELWPGSLKTTARILLHSRFPMWMAWGPELTILYNDAYARDTLGKKHPWALGKPARQVWSEIWSDIAPRIERVLSTGQASWDEMLMLILERSGYREETYHTFSYSPLIDGAGKKAGMLCVVMEDTARVISERQVAALSALSNSLSEAITEQDVFSGIERGLSRQLDMPFALLYMLDAVTNQLRLVACTGIDHTHPAAPPEITMDEDVWPWPVARVLSSRQAVTQDTLSVHFAHLPKGGWDIEPTQAHLVPIIRPGQETPAGIFIAGLNPYRQLDAGYAGFLDLVAGQIAASITNAQAFEGERRRAESLAELDRAKTTFFSNVSHELRTPLTLILGPIEDALGNQSAPSRSSLEMLHRNALRLLKLVNGLLDFMRIESGRLKANYEPTDLALFTAQLASVFRSAVERAGLRLTVDCRPLPEPVFVDREMWEKIVLNLLSNALKSTFDGEIRISIREDHGRVRLAVSDTGTGIPESEIPKLFQRFQRVEGARRRSHEGTGIGLALVRELTEMHTGAISISSKVGLGTTFTISLPFGSAHLNRGQIAAETPLLTATPASATPFVEEALSWSPRKPATTWPSNDATTAPLDAENKPVILVVDDNSDMREYAASLLTTRFHVVSAENGRRALMQIEQIKPDLVVTDIMMPELDGFGLLAELRARPATRTIPVIMLSARAGEEARVDGIEAGADDYLIKPFTARELVAHVDAQLKMARMRKEAMEQEAALESEIRRARQFAWEALEHIPEAFCTLDKDYRVTYLNSAAATLTARSGKDPLNRSVWESYPTLLGTAVETNLRRAMEDRAPVVFEHYFQSENTEAWFEFRVHPQPGEGLVIYLRNTTDNRKAEQALRRSEQLAAAGRLAASIAHEINNPLEAVTNLLFLAKLDPTLQGKTKDVLDMADSELQRLSHIAARSLRFYRQRTAPVPTSIEDMIETVLFFNAPDLRVRMIDLDKRYRPAPSVVCLPGELQQVVTNLIRNAIDAMPSGGRLISAVRPAHAGGRNGVAVTIADTGAGMDQSTLARIFHPFVTTKGDSGTGLGLWVSKGILDSHHATIKVRSKPGRGTVFRIFFPLDAGEPQSLAGQPA